MTEGSVYLSRVDLLLVNAFPRLAHLVSLATNAT